MSYPENISTLLKLIPAYNETRKGFLRKNIVAVFYFFQNCAIPQYS